MHFHRDSEVLAVKNKHQNRDQHVRKPSIAAFYRGFRIGSRIRDSEVFLVFESNVIKFSTIENLNEDFISLNEHYDCFVPPVCEKIFKLHVGNHVIPYNF